jgi:hypothetical protein
MMIHTASEGVSLARKLESESASLYEELERRYSQNAQTFLAFAKENKNNVSLINGAYYGVISDALESGFAFNLDPQDYSLDLVIPGNASGAEIQDQLIKMEEQIIRFYNDAFGQSQFLMADVPRTFSIIARKRANRLSKIRALKA